MYYRRKILLALLQCLPQDKIERIKLQKMLFLFCQKSSDYYQFVPYKYGMYSFIADNDLRILAQHYQQIEIVQDAVKMQKTNNYYEQLKTRDQTILTKLIEQHGADHINELISYCYDNYPYYTINTKRQLKKPQQQRLAIEKNKIKRQQNQTLFTIGYEGICIEEYLNRLIHHNVSLLCDVRKNPLSMKYGFSKNQLTQYCTNVGIEYRHLPGLGIESAQRQNLNNSDDYAKLFARYQTTLADKKPMLREVKQLCEKYNRIALTCFEASVNCCHRGVLATQLSRLFGLETEHL